MASLGYYLQKPVQKIRAAIPRFVAKDRRALPEGQFVSICFDDFPKSAVTRAKPMLERRGWKATWYAAGSMIGQDHPDHGKMFDRDDLETLTRDGHDIGCHTFSHLDCVPSDDETVMRDLSRNREFFRKHKLPRARSFAYPFGRVDVGSKRLLLQQMPAMRGVHPGIQSGSIDRGLLHATGIEDHNGGTARALHQLSSMKGDREWLIIFTHDIDESPSSWGCSPQDFENLPSAVDQSGAEVVTVADMLSRIEEAH